MPIDKSWICKPRNTIEYANGLNVFLDIAFQHANGPVIKCPCAKCGFKKWQTRDVVQEHLTCTAFPRNYTTWYLHGEGSSVTESMVATSAHVIEDLLESQNPMEDMLNDAFGFAEHDEDTETDGLQTNMVGDEGNTNFEELMRDNNEPLYEGCTKYSKLSFMLKLYHIKCMSRMSDKTMTMILELLKDAFEHAKFPNSFYEAKTVITKLGLNYVKIPACPKDCMLYWGEDLIAGVCGQLASNHVLFPISFEKWSTLPDTYKDTVWESALKSRFCFKVNEDMAKRDVMFKIGKLWREYRCKLWNEFYDPLMSRSDLIKNVPAGLNMEQWAVFVDYRLRPSTVNMCNRNRDIRKRQIIPHTSGAMSLSRRRNNLKIETGKNIGRAEMWKITHKRKNGTYVNDEALEIGEKIDELMLTNPKGGSDISPEDPIGVIFGKEHPGRVRGLSYGACPSLAFKGSTTRLSAMNHASSSSTSSSVEDKVTEMEKEHGKRACNCEKSNEHFACIYCFKKRCSRTFCCNGS